MQQVRAVGRQGSGERPGTRSERVREDEARRGHRSRGSRDSPEVSKPYVFHYFGEGRRLSLGRRRELPAGARNLTFSPDSERRELSGGPEGPRNGQIAPHLLPRSDVETFLSVESWKKWPRAHFGSCARPKNLCKNHQTLIRNSTRNDSRMIDEASRRIKDVEILKNSR